MEQLIVQNPWLGNPWIVALLLAWIVLWKGLALWKAARNNSKPWFVVLLVVNTVGILEIIYFFCVGKKKKA